MLGEEALELAIEGSANDTETAWENFEHKQQEN